MSRRVATTRLDADTCRFWQTLPMPGERTQERIEDDSTPEAAGSRPKSDDTAGSQPRAEVAEAAGQRLREIGGPKGPEPTRFGDWERAGRCVDF